MKRLYDVNFRVKGPMCVVIEASSAEEAQAIFESMDLDKQDLIERFLASNNYYGLEVTSVEKC